MPDLKCRGIHIKQSYLLATLSAEAVDADCCQHANLSSLDQVWSHADGWRILNEMLGGIYVGPETQYFGSHGYRNLRVGAHITSMRAEDTEWSAATGWAWDSQARASPYVRINVLKRL